MRIIIAFLGMLMIGGIVLSIGSNTTVTNVQPEATTVVETVVVDATDVRIKAAQDADMERINAEADTMRVSFIDNQLSIIETAVLKEIEAETKARRIEAEKKTGAYWRDEQNTVALIMSHFPEDPYTAVAVARRESGLRMVQSAHVYTARNAPAGFQVGDREQSFCMFQIHEPVHKATIKAHGLEDYRTNVESCVKMARVVYNQSGFYPWSVYKDILAMR